MRRTEKPVIRLIHQRPVVPQPKAMLGQLVLDLARHPCEWLVSSPMMLVVVRV